VLDFIKIKIFDKKILPKNIKYLLSYQKHIIHLKQKIQLWKN